jgi:colanic acid/amylovoran biosynthesis glycosyltransferase
MSAHAEPMSGPPLVVHYREEFPVLSETFIRETVTRHRRYSPLMITHTATADPRDAGVTLRELAAGRATGFAGRSAAVRIARRTRLLTAVLTAERPAVVHAHFGEESVVAADATHGLAIPLVAAFYGYDATELARSFIWRRRFRRLFARATAVLAEGPHMAARLIDLGAAPERVVVHPIPVRLELFPFCPPTAPVDGEPLIFLQACRFVEKKGVDVTIEAFARIAADASTAVLWLMGGGPEEKRLRALAASTGVADRITFLPARSHDKYAMIMRQAHVFVHPSRTARNGDGEGGAPTALLEAQALGLPIIATTHADIPAVVDDDAAMLAAPGDSAAVAGLMLRMLRSAHEWSARAEAGRRQVVDRHDPARLAAVLESLYDAVRA